MIAKLAIRQGRLYCLKVRADAVVGGDWAEKSSALRQDMEAIVSSYAAVPISRRCVRDSNRGRVPSGVWSGTASRVGMMLRVGQSVGGSPGCRARAAVL